MRKNGFLLVVLFIAIMAMMGCKKGSKEDDSTPNEVAVKVDSHKKDVNNTEVSKAVESNNGSLAIPAPTPDFSGEYQGSRAVLEIQKMSPQLSRFSLQMATSSECTGDMNGVLSMVTDNHGEYVEKDCALQFDFDNQLIQIKEEGSHCHDYHSDGCSFTDDYQVGGAVKEQTKIDTTSVAGHYVHKRVSIDDTQCNGWELWLTGSNMALDGRISIYAGSCDAESIGVENLKYNVTSSTLDFDVLQDGSVHHFAGTFNSETDLYGQFTY